VLFSPTWMQQYQRIWNADTDMVRSLETALFNGSIAYGFMGKVRPEGYLNVQQGRIEAVSTALADGVHPDWDLRAGPELWQEWITCPPGLMQVGMAFSARRFCFARGDYVQILKNPLLAKAFVRSFELMHRVCDEAGADAVSKTPEVK